MIGFHSKSMLAYLQALLLVCSLISCDNQEESEQDEPEVASENILRFESGTFDSSKPTIVFFGGGNCVNSWEGTESWDNEETVGDQWFDKANVISFYGYRMDKGASDTTYFEAASMVTDTILAMAPDYSQDIQVCGFSTGGTPALDLAIHINLKSENLSFTVTHVTLMDSPCYDYTSRFASLTSTPGYPMIINLIGGLYKEYREPYPSVLNVDVVDAHDEVFWWYVNSISVENGNNFNDGVTAGSYLSVIGDGRDIRIPVSEKVTHFFDWQGDVLSGKYTLIDSTLYPGKLDGLLK